MIEPSDVMPLLLKACPSFASEWATIESENLDELSPTGRLHYIDAGDFIGHMVRLRLADDTHEFPAIFDVLERLGLPRVGVTSDLWC